MSAPQVVYIVSWVVPDKNNYRVFSSTESAQAYAQEIEEQALLLGVMIAPVVGTYEVSE